MRLVGFVLVVCALIAAGCSGANEKNELEIGRGRAIYEQNCQICHGDAKTGESGVSGAPVHGPGGHTWHHADGQLVGIVLGELNYPGRSMPSFEGVLSEDEVLDVLSYLKTNWSSEQRRFQEEASANWEELRRTE
jgi:mono/diheme cytochrome c family protein